MSDCSISEKDGCALNVDFICSAKGDQGIKSVIFGMVPGAGLGRNSHSIDFRFRVAA